MNKNTTCNLRTQSLDLLRFPLAVFVLIIHVFACGVSLGGDAVDVNSVPILSKCSVIIAGFLGRQSVPVYYFISGFVFFHGINRLDKENYLHKMKNRSKTLLIPYIIWNSFSIILVALTFFPVLAPYVPGIQDAKLIITPSSIWHALWNYNGELVFWGRTQPDSGAVVHSGTFPINTALWFIRDLILVVLTTPLIYRIIKRTKFYAIVLLGILWFGSSYFKLGHFNHLTIAFFFFSWGAYMSINKKDMLIEFKRFWKPSLFLYPLLSILYIVSVYHYPDATNTLKRLNIIVGLFFAYNLSAWLLTHGVCKVNPFLASSSFFIYVSHAIVIGPVLKILFKVFAPQSQLGVLSLYMLDIILSVFILLAVFYALRIYTPSFLKVIAGRK